MPGNVSARVADLHRIKTEFLNVRSVTISIAAHTDEYVVPGLSEVGSVSDERFAEPGIVRELRKLIVSEIVRVTNRILAVLVDHKITSLRGVGGQYSLWDYFGSSALTIMDGVCREASDSEDTAYLAYQGEPF